MQSLLRMKRRHFLAGPAAPTWAEDRLWLSEGKQHLLRSLPPLFAAGVEILRQGGIGDIADPSTLYTNRFIDEVLKG